MQMDRQTYGAVLKGALQGCEKLVHLTYDNRAWVYNLRTNKRITAINFLHLSKRLSKYNISDVL
jgi:hypothetical protein